MEMGKKRLMMGVAAAALCGIMLLRAPPTQQGCHPAVPSSSSSAAELGPPPQISEPGRSVLVTGGAGFIGSHAALQLLEEGWAVTIIDNLSRGNMGAIRVLEQHAASLPGGAGRLSVVIGDLGDRALLERVLRRSRIDVVIHFAAIAFVGESTADPLRYYHNITANTMGLLEAMHRTGVRVCAPPPSLARDRQAIILTRTQTAMHCMPPSPVAASMCDVCACVRARVVCWGAWPHWLRWLRGTR
jgi:UDP-arabinose 4-epimerase